MAADALSNSESSLDRRDGEQTLEKADLSNANLEGASFRGWNCAEVVLTNANLLRVDFHAADLQHANLRAAELTGADLGEAILVQATLKGANLRLASLRDANLQGADLKWSQLSGADLSGANLSETLLQGAVADAATVWPKDFDFEAAGVWMSK